MPCRCDLQPFDDIAFDQCLAGRRLIMIGDSTMNGLYISLGCLMRHLSEGALSTWDVSKMPRIKDEYQSRVGPIFKQVRRPLAQPPCPPFQATTVRHAQ